MKRFLKYPLANIICICLFTAFYAASVLYAVPFCLEGGAGGMAWFGDFIAGGGALTLSAALIAVTALTSVLLALRKRPFDEYHTSLLSVCLITALILTIVAVGIFFVNIIADPTDIRLKFTLFALIHWTTVAAADLVFVLICGRK